MPPVRRSLRDRNRDAIEQPAPAAPEHQPGPTPTTSTAAPDEHPTATPSPTPSIAPSMAPSRPSGGGAAPARTAAPRTTRTRRTGARKGRDGAAQAAREGATNIPVARILYLPEDLIEALRIYRATNGMTNTQVALRALNATYKRIPELLEHEARAQVIAGDLFDEVIPVPARSNRQVEITPTAAQLGTIDPLVTSTGANDRSHLFALALRQFLTDAGLIQP